MGAACVRWPQMPLPLLLGTLLLSVACAPRPATLRRPACCSAHWLSTLLLLMAEQAVLAPQQVPRGAAASAAMQLVSLESTTVLPARSHRCDAFVARTLSTGGAGTAQGERQGVCAEGGGQAVHHQVRQLGMLFDLLCACAPPLLRWGTGRTASGAAEHHKGRRLGSRRLPPAAAARMSLLHEPCIL